MSSGMIGIIASDMRQIYMAEILEEKGYQVHLWNLMEKREETEKEKEAHCEIWNAQALILPVPVSRLKDDGQILKEITEHADTIKEVFGGAFPTQWKETLEAAGIQTTDVLEDESIARKNAVATAEGTVAELMKLMPVNLEGSHVTVFGFGKCGRVIAEKLYCMGAAVSVTARSEQALELARFFGFESIPLASEDLRLATADAVVNTIPAPVIGKKEIDQLKDGAVIVDIASAPGGCDSIYCGKKGIPYKLALGLPGVYSPKTSALILLQAMPF